MGRALAVAGLALGLGAGTALADVKTGVDAWGRGDYATAIREWQAAADRDDPDGEFNLAQAYKLGRGVPQDLARAEGLYARAAAQGHVQAADNYGLLLFQRGEHEKALPYIRAGAEHGDPRAQYLYGIALFNGDGVTKDWVRAYALVNLAQQQGLPQAAPALAQMDQYIPLEQRQRGVAAATDLAAQAEASRSRQFASMDLGNKPQPTARGVSAGASAYAPSPTPAITRPLASASPVPPPARPLPPLATADGRPIDRGRLITSGAPLARASERTPPMAVAPPPAVAPARPAAAKPVAPKPVPPKPGPVRMAEPAAAKTPPARGAEPAARPSAGTWRIQLGAFGVPANADAQWARVRGLPEVAGHARINLKSGAVTRLLAGGYSEDGARAACRKLAAGGIACIPSGS